MSEPIRRYGAPGVDDDLANGDLILTWYGGPNHDVEVQIRIAPEAIPGFIREVTNHGLTALAHTFDSETMGDCEMCGNIRMIDVEHPGRGVWREHCPECSGNRRSAPFMSAPIVGPRRKAGFDA